MTAVILYSSRVGSVDLLLPVSKYENAVLTHHTHRQTAHTRAALELFKVNIMKVVKPGAL